MSRCFPFPPPGYEKARVDNADLLKKVKQKEKRHKKDRKEKEKKEKKDKDRSKEKHKGKKERKEKHREKDRDKEKEKDLTSNEKKVAGQPRLSNGEKLGPNNLESSDKDKNFLYVQELAKRIRDENGASGSQIVHKVVPPDQRRTMEQTMVVETSLSNHFGGKGKNEIDDYGKVNGQRNLIDTRPSEKTFGQNLSGLHKRVEAVAKLEEIKDVEKQMEGKGKRKHMESDGKIDKLKDREREKNKKSKDKEEKKKAKEIIEPSVQQPKLNENVSRAQEGGKDSLDFRNSRSSESLKLSTIGPAGERNIGKRKEPEKNGYLFDHGSRPNKLSRTVSSSHPVVENGKKLEPGQTVQGLANNHAVDMKEQKKINGSIAGYHQSNLVLTKSSSANENGETLLRPPHPDMKYLSQILSVPVVEEWSEEKDQEWLFGDMQTEPKKPSEVSCWNEGTRQVWAEAFRIEPADISAMPYVIPY